MLLTEAAVAAVHSGEEAINQHTLTLAAYTGPTERRRQFEQRILDTPRTWQASPTRRAWLASLDSPKDPCPRAMPSVPFQPDT